MYKKILVPLEPAGYRDNLDHARRLAERLEAELIVLRVVTVMPSEDPFFKQIQVEVGSVGARARAGAEAQMASIEHELRAQHLNAHGAVVTSDKSEAEAIVAYAETEGCDLIVMSTYRQSTLSRWFLGSIGDKVRQRSSVPVLFVAANV
jgi:nucleotide-binding universal stress UspA family protein